VNAAYLTARRSGAPARILDLHRRWIKQATEKVKAKAQQDAAEMSMAAPGMMPGMPAPNMPAAAMADSALPGIAATM
jgi:tRNA A37 threonylcarbamoyltransferase TsaD